jgi:ubiquinone/menaquinone biosynthesis C-methylase UbiE
VSSFIYMRILESSPERYDAALALLSYGQAVRLKERIVELYVQPEQRLLEIGCGTGTLAVMAARRGARVLGFDISPGMLAVARRKVAGLSERLRLEEMGVAGMEELPAGSFDLVVATLVFSELSPAERLYTLRQARRVLVPGGRLVVADEVPPRGLGRRLLHAGLRLPVLLLTFLLTQRLSRPVADLEALVRGSGLEIERVERTFLDSLATIAAGKGK